MLNKPSPQSKHGPFRISAHYITRNLLGMWRSPPRPAAQTIGHSLTISSGTKASCEDREILPCVRDSRELPCTEREKKNRISRLSKFLISESSGFGRNPDWVQKEYQHRDSDVWEGESLRTGGKLGLEYHSLVKPSPPRRWVSQASIILDTCGCMASEDTSGAVSTANYSIDIKVVDPQGFTQKVPASVIPHSG